MTDEIVRECLSDLPRHLKGLLECAEQDWGWSCAVDVLKPSPIINEWRISGAWFSAKIADDFAAVLKRLLEARGLKVKLGKFS